MQENLQNFLENLLQIIPEKTSRQGLRRNLAPAKAKKIWQSRPSSSNMTQFMMHFMRCAKTKLATAKFSAVS